MPSKLVMATPTYQLMLDRLTRNGPRIGSEVGSAVAVESPYGKFPEGTRWIQVPKYGEGRFYDKDVVLIGGITDDTSFAELTHGIQMLGWCGVHKLEVIIPYFRNGTQERYTYDKGEVPLGQFDANLLGMLGANVGSRQTLFHLVDVHAEAILTAFGHQVGTRHLYAMPIHAQAIAKIIEQEGGRDHCVIANTDGGRVAWVESLANESEVQLPVALMLKGHVEVGGADTVEKKGASGLGNVRGKVVIIFDDLIRSGKSIKLAADTYLAAGARKVIVVSTHAPTAASSVEYLCGLKTDMGDRLIDSLHVTDTCEEVYAAQQALPEESKSFLQIHTVESLLIQTINR